jgi:hypothetical protein
MRRPDLVPDCASCAALCCVATSFEASEDFAHDKPAGVPCRYLRRDCRCSIHEELGPRGYPGCAIYDCYGAGQRATRAFAGRPGSETERDVAFFTLRVLHELLWMLTEAFQLCPPACKGVRAELEVEIHALDSLAQEPPGLTETDLAQHRRIANAILRRVGDALGGRERAAAALGLSTEGPLLQLARR